MHTTMSSAGVVFLADLREKTGPMHKQLESNPLSAALMQPGVTHAQYAHYLSFFYPVIAYCEQTVFPLVQEFVNTGDRRKLHWLKQDLASLQASPVEKPFHPQTDGLNMAGAMGVMYVMEGATLGGKVILKHLGDKLGIDEHHSARFLFGYGNDTGRQWTIFLEAFTAYVTEHRVEKAAIAAAQSMFASIDRYFQGNR
ncbi:biliverdin-producing heme oxygenase [Sediminibacterium soli]|uniref:biliverdin-producing heme oxygenase n=1 Tax=Sediminibacterium soli TaxID=2698829 RepID=UPI00137B80B4|nr:biliverdin-producing heme oxygenase [Sediminibacterium soli]NCI47247.1 biliverdin-producing heme oxygenase [Sediminibacterium soli]